MGLKQISYSCGGTSTEIKILKFQLNNESKELSGFIYYIGPCNPDTGEFFPNDLKKTNVKNIGEISNHIEGIKLMLETEHDVKDPTFKLE